MKSILTQAGGDHYQRCAIQPIEYIQANGLGYEEGNVIKYITRHASKGGAEDLQKAIQYVRFILEHHYGILSEVSYEKPAKGQNKLDSLEQKYGEQTKQIIQILNDGWANEGGRNE